MKTIFRISILIWFSIIIDGTLGQIHAQTNERAPERDPFDQELLNLIDEYKRKKAYGNSTEAANLYQQITDIGKHAYPERLQELEKLLKDSEQPKGIGTEKTSSKDADDPNRKWYFIQSDKALQYSFSFVREEAGIGYAQVHVRINKKDKIYCNHPTCQGYIWYFTYRTPDDEKREYYFYIANTYEGIYTPDVLIPFAIKTYPDGSRQAFSASKDFIVYYLPGSSEEYMTRKFYNCVDDKLSNYAGNRCRDFKMEMATVVR